MRVAAIVVGVFVGVLSVAVVGAVVLAGPLDKARLVVLEQVASDGGRVSGSEGRGVFVKRKLLRRTVEGDKISNRFCAMDANNKCDWTGYVLFLVGVILVQLVFAGLMLVCSPILACFRLCGCMGGRKPRPGLCCGSGKEEKLYSHGTVMGVKGVGALILFACFVCLVTAYVGNGRTSDGVSGMWEALIKSANTLAERINRIGTSLEALPYTQDISGSLAEASRSVRSFSSDMSTAKSTVTKYEIIRALAANLSLLIPFLLFATSLVLGVFNKRGCCIHIILATVVGMALSMVWVSTAVHSTFAIVFDDACDEFASFLDGSNPDNLIDTLVGCSSSSGLASGFDGLRDDAVSGQTQSADAACSDLTPYCTAVTPPNIPNCPAGTCNADTLPSYRQSTWTPTANTNNAALSVTDCATQCVTGSTEQLVSARALVNIDDVIAYTDVLDNEILPLLNCDFLVTLVRDLYSAFCKKLTSGLKIVSGAQIAMAVFLTLGMIVLWLGQKRFIHRDDCKDGAGGDDYYKGDTELAKY